MITDTSVKFFALIAALIPILIGSIVLHEAGFVIGLVLSPFAGWYVFEFLVKFTPDNRRRRRRMQRFEGQI